MDLERLRSSTQEVDDTTRRSNEVKAKAAENIERYNAMLAEVRHFINALTGAREIAKLSSQLTNYIVVEKGVELPALGKGYMAARVESLGTAYVGETRNFYFHFDHKQNLDDSAKPGTKITGEYFATNNSNLPTEVPTLHGVDSVDYRHEEVVDENTAKLDAMLANIAETLQLLITAAMNPELNPQIAEQVQRYYQEREQVAEQAAVPHSTVA